MISIKTHISFSKILKGHFYQTVNNIGAAVVVLDPNSLQSSLCCGTGHSIQLISHLTMPVYPPAGRNANQGHISDGRTIYNDGQLFPQGR
ncbi:hypothetical protein PoB_005761500 [Plakobranchus ocellatus]|uniref:Uncharacterized protein n=1 Tax=Plakobranchus ocellatus TaxID=259542 RepID=A0AAV4CHT1_9GAST|nr:hypothetical protein PoB_005761500 [Plakobranchus ocellatus]